MQATVLQPPPARRARTQRRRSRRKRLWLIALVLVLNAALIFGSVTIWNLRHETSRPRPQHPPTALRERQPFNWHGHVPVGITLSGLQSYLLTGALEETMCRQIRAAHRYWHANTIRLQIAQDKLVGQDGHEFNRAYLAAIKGVSGCVFLNHMTLVLNAQTEQSVGFAADESLPTYATTRFWDRILAIPGYKNSPRVVLDLFNEPRRCNWDQWYSAMQPLVNHIRASGATNTIWAEGIWWGSSLEGVPLLHGKGIVYSFHHPGAPAAGMRPFDKGTWDAAFGRLADSGVPVVDGEFSNYKGSYNWPDGQVLVPEYLRYLTAHHIGMLGWGLLPGALNGKGGYLTMSIEPEGAGYIMNRWFAATNPPHHHKHHRRLALLQHRT